jgi:hypothetical protein
LLGDLLTVVQEKVPIKIVVFNNGKLGFMARKNETALDDIRARFETLSPREREVMVHLVPGRLSKQIAGEFGISGTRLKCGLVPEKIAERIFDIVNQLNHDASRQYDHVSDRRCDFSDGHGDLRATSSTQIGENDDVHGRHKESRMPDVAQQSGSAGEQAQDDCNQSGADHNE